MRWIILLLVFINALLLSQLMGWTRPILEDRLDSSRKAAQIAPETARVVLIDQVIAVGSVTSAIGSCFDIGPIAPADAEVFRANLQKLTPAIKVEMFDTEEGATFWVMVPPSATPKDALRREQEARNAGVRETYVIQEGPEKLAISLGIFKTDDAAKNLISTLNAKGMVGISVVRKPNPPKNIVRLPVVPTIQLEATRKLFLQMPVAACPRG
jgi:hypothetical protein